jgi:hypothetical protein
MIIEAEGCKELFARYWTLALTSVIATNNMPSLEGAWPSAVPPLQAVVDFKIQLGLGQSAMK